MKNFAQLTDSFSPIDRMLLAFFISFSGIFFYFWLNYSPVIKNRDLKNIAKLDQLDKDVRFKVSGNFDWVKPKMGSGLIHGDQVFTGENSSATITFLKDNSKILLKPNSLITIEELDDRLSIEVEKGALVIESKTEESITLVDSNGKKEKAVPVGKPIIIQKLGSDTKIESELPKNIPRIMAPDINETFKLSSIANFKLSSKAKGLLEISKNYDFRTIDKVVTLNDDNSAQVELDTDGDFYSRINVEGTYSGIVPFNVVRSSDIVIFSPQPNQVLNLARGDSILLDWQRDEKFQDEVIVTGDGKKVISIDKAMEAIRLESPKFRKGSLQVNRYKNGKLISKSDLINFLIQYAPLEFINPPKEIFVAEKEIPQIEVKKTVDENYEIELVDLKQNKLVTKKESKQTVAKFGDLPPSKYQVRVNSLTYPSQSPTVDEFIVSKSILNMKPIKEEMEFFEPEGNVDFKISKTYLPSEKINFQVKINGKENNNVISLEQNKVSISLSDFGEYCVVASVKDEDLKEIYLPEEKCVNVKKKNPFPVVSKAPEQVLDYQGSGKEEVYHIKLPYYNNASEYRLFIYTDKEAKKLLFSSKAKKNSVEWVSNRSGIYYYRYQLADDKGRESEMSPISRLVFPISPLSDW